MRHIFVFLLVLLHGMHIQSVYCRPTAVQIEKRSMHEIYQEALKESGTLKVAWGGDAKISATIIASVFEKTYPGVKLDIELDVSKYLDGRIDLAYKASNGSNNGVDIAVLQTLQDFPRWKCEDRLLPYKVAPWNDIYPQFVDTDGYYTGLYIFSFGATVYNPKVTHKSTLPVVYTDFLKPGWRNKLILAYPNDDDAVLFLFDNIIDKYGFHFVHSLVAQNPQWVRGTVTPASLMIPSTTNSTQKTSNNEAISFTATGGYVSGVAQVPSDDVYVTWPQTGAIFKTTTMPESAKLFMGFLMDKTWQGLVGGTYATRRTFDKLGVFNQTRSDPLAYGRFMADRQRVEALRFKIESVIGPPQGKDPTV